MHKSWKDNAHNQIVPFIKKQKHQLNLNFEEKNITSKISWKSWPWCFFSIIFIFILEGVFLLTKESLTLSASQKQFLDEI